MPLFELLVLCMLASKTDRRHNCHACGARGVQGRACALPNAVPGSRPAHHDHRFRSRTLRRRYDESSATRLTDMAPTGCATSIRVICARSPTVVNTTSPRPDECSRNSRGIGDTGGRHLPSRDPRHLDLGCGPYFDDRATRGRPRSWACPRTRQPSVSCRRAINASPGGRARSDLTG